MYSHHCFLIHSPKMMPVQPLKCWTVLIQSIKVSRLREKPRKATKEVEATGDLVTNHVNVFEPGESVIHQDSQKLETLNLFHVHTVNPQVQSTVDLLLC